MYSVQVYFKIKVIKKVFAKKKKSVKFKEI